MTSMPPVACTACQAVLLPAARFCSHCGFPVGSAAAARPRAQWYYNTWFVLFMLFFVLGPFGLPLAWKHPRWPRSVKMLLTLIVLAYTLWLLQVSFQTAQVVLQHFQQMNAPYAF